MTSELVPAGDLRVFEKFVFPEYPHWGEFYISGPEKSFDENGFVKVRSTASGEPSSTGATRKVRKILG